jgi:hypothetical protein
VLKEVPGVTADIIMLLVYKREGEKFWRKKICTGVSAEGASYAHWHSHFHYPLFKCDLEIPKI